MSVLPGPLVSAAWLAEHADQVVIADVRWYPDGRSGRAAYDDGHLPGARWLDLDADLAGPPTPDGGRHPFPSPEAFAATLGRLGVASATPVVAYDDAGGSIAGRLWWMLDVIGQPAAVLDGGLAAWSGPLVTSASGGPTTPSASGGPTTPSASGGPTTPSASGGPTAPWPATVERVAIAWPTERFVTTEQVAELRTPDPAHPLLLDARAAARYDGSGWAPGLDPRPGHIPGARSAPWADNLDSGTGRFRSAAALADRYHELGADAEQRIVVACGSGVTACHDLLALRLAGRTNLALYTGSFSSWGADPARPVVMGPHPY